MNTRRLMLTATLVALLGAPITGALAQSSATSSANKVVFQVSDADPGKWSLALNNARNVQQELGKDQTTVEIVAYGPGIGMLKFDSASGKRVAEALAAGVTVVACQNTMRSLQLSPDDMLPSIGYVPAGVVELMLRQKEGYAYIRP